MSDNSCGDIIIKDIKIFRVPFEYLPPQRKLGIFLYDKKNNEIKTPGFYVSLDWHETIQDLSDTDAGVLLKNMFNYSLELPLLETNAVIKAICTMTVFKTIDINKGKYIEKCEKVG